MCDPPKSKEILDIMRKSIISKIQQNLVLKQNILVAKLKKKVLLLHLQKESESKEIHKLIRMSKFTLI
jgi:hypothetical protein